MSKNNSTRKSNRSKKENGSKSNGSKKIKQEIKIGNSPENISPTIFKRSFKFKAYNESNVIPNANEFRKRNIIHPTANEIEAIETKMFGVYRGQKVIKDTLNKFIQLYPNATFEEFIQYLHPDNACIDKDGIIKIDPRLYIEGSDTLRYWKNVQKKLRKKRLARKSSTFNIFR